ncbi:hypothetical protein GIB67_030108 [Kingdonia uniflora]|uniref:NECAP PHear domain-containing protein n=1 Tax=Kingdonia uniflora TaxID=39325 RepID=A0A7J7L2K6_9MAGN|nr:hypothetical protein GIB67_030108 [Kingdonia uniflora]
MENISSHGGKDQGDDDEEEIEAVELNLFQVSECYVYMFQSQAVVQNCPPIVLYLVGSLRNPEANSRNFLNRGTRVIWQDILKVSNISIGLIRRKILRQNMGMGGYGKKMADEWNVNKWAWEGTLKVISKGDECIIKLEDKVTGELYARAFLRDGEPHPVETVIDSSRYFVLQVEENIGGRVRHAFIGIGFRDRTQAYDFQAALHDHMKYLNKKKIVEEMEQQPEKTSSVDYSLKEGETLVLQINNFTSNSKPLDERPNKIRSPTCIKPPPAPLSPVNVPPRSPEKSSSNFSLEGSKKFSSYTDEHRTKEPSFEKQIPSDIPEDDFGDFQAAG